MSTELRPLLHGEILPAATFSANDLMVFAEQVARSKLFVGIDNPAAAYALMLLCQAEGLHPATALKRYHIIKGRPSMRADAMQAEFQARGGVIRWGKSDDTECVATFFHPVQAPDGVTITWNLKRASQAGLTGNGTWKNYPAAMLRARAISEGVRMVLPGVVAGIYTPEEVQDFEPAGFPRNAPEPTTTKTNGSHVAEKPRKTWEETMNGAVRLWEKLDPRDDRQEDIARHWRLINGLVTWAIEAELVSEERITNREGKRDRDLVRAAATWLYDSRPGEVRRQLKVHIDDAIARDNAPTPPARERQEHLPNADRDLPPARQGDAFEEFDAPTTAEAN